MAIFTTFAEHVDSLAAAISSRDIERIVETSDSADGTTPPPHDTLNRA